MRFTGAELAIYEIPPHLGEPFSDAVQRVALVEVISLSLLTDTGDDGWGFTYTIGRGGSAIRSLLADEFLPLLPRMHPLDHERILRTLWTASRWIGRTGLTMMALAALDNALWDLKGKHFGEPLYRLLGGHTTKVPIYASDAGWMNLSLDEMKRRAVRFSEEGFQGVKLKVGRETLQEDVERVRVARETIGDAVPLMIDANAKFALPDAMRLAHELSPFGIAWFEEPMHCDQPASHAELRSKTSIPIAVGESLYSKFEFTRYVEQDAVDIVQPDAGRIGVTEWMKVAHMAECHGLRVAPHAFFELHAHLVAACPNGLVVEYIPYLDRVLETPMHPENGYVFPPDRPGHGMVLSEERSREYRTENQTIMF